MRLAFSIAVICFGFACTTANATMLMSSVELNNTNIDLGSPYPPYGTVTVTGDTDTGLVTITLEASQSGDLFFRFAWNVDETALGSEAFTVTGVNGAGATDDWDVNGPGEFGGYNGFGKFDWEVVAPNGQSGRLDPVVVEIQFTSYDSSTDSALVNPDNFIVANTTGYSFSAHLVPSGGGATIIIADGDPFIPGVPEPSSLLLAGLGAFAGLGLRHRRRLSAGSQSA